MSSGGDAPNRVPDVVGNQEGAGLVDRQPDRSTARVLVWIEKAGDDVLGFATRMPAAEWHEHDFVAVEDSSVPTSVFADEGAPRYF